MKKTSKPHYLTLFCKCGIKLIKYKKGQGRKLVKIHSDRVVTDYLNLFINYFPENTNIFCTNCEKRIATIKKINGKFVNKLNQGQIGIIKKG
ncbi:MAG: hypothetical protein LRZ98_00330 [Candidatus Pacebacteria bacterium]|nr:hypothetical protein [Candidatus Paceibacterota bacterium]